MAQNAEIFPGAVPARGAIRPGGVLSPGRGANSGLIVHPVGRQVVSAWCGADSSLDVWSIDPLRAIQSLPIEVELPDMGAQVDAALMPPGVDASRAGWPAHLLPVADLAISEAGAVIALAAGRAVRLMTLAHDGSGLRPVASLRGHDNAVARVATSRSGDRVLSTESSGRLLVWGVPEQRPLLDLRITRAPHCAAFVWNDLLAGVGDDIGRVICWELQEGRRHLQFQAHRGPVTRMTFSSHNGLLLTAGADNVARMWNLESGRQIGADMPHAGSIHDALFAHDGRFVVTCGSDGHVAVWSASTGALVDWCFEGTPVYRLAYHTQTGLLLYAGPRTIRAADADWTSLRNLDGGVGQAGFSSQPAYLSPPQRPQVNYAGQAVAEAPIGSVMAARQTSDLPMPDRSNLVIARDQQAANFPLGGPARPFGTQALSPIGGGAPASGAVPLQAPMPAGFGARGPSTMAMPALGVPAPVGQPGGLAGGAFPSAPPPPTGQVARPVQQPSQASSTGGFFTQQRPAGGTQPPGTPFADADEFFASAATSTSAGAALDATRPPVLPTPPARESRALNAPGKASAAPPSFDEQLTDENPRTGGGGTAIAVIAPPKAPSKELILAGVLVGALLGFGARAAVTGHYTTRAYPASISASAAAVELAHTTAVDTAQRELDAFRAQSDERLADFERSGTMIPSELDRLRQNVARQIAVEERRFEEARGAADHARDTSLAELEETRRIEAAKTGNIAGGVVAALGVLGGTIAHNRKHRRKSDSSPSPAATPASAASTNRPGRRR